MEPRTGAMAIRATGEAVAYGLGALRGEVAGDIENSEEFHKVGYPFALPTVQRREAERVSQAPMKLEVRILSYTMRSVASLRRQSELGSTCQLPSGFAISVSQRSRSLQIEGQSLTMSDVPNEQRPRPRVGRVVRAGCRLEGSVVVFPGPRHGSTPTTPPVRVSSHSGCFGG